MIGLFLERLLHQNYVFWLAMKLVFFAIKVMVSVRLHHLLSDVSYWTFL